MADTFIFIIYFPLLFACKKWSKQFARWTGVTKEESERLDRAVGELKTKFEAHGGSFHGWGGARWPCG